jgi:predicted TIM-barrel fold metal-dependent hydrolase
MSRYLVVSGDGHAGPPAERYREYLDAEYREAFDAHQAQVRQMLEFSRGDKSREDFVKKWESITGGDGGLRAAYDSDHRNDVLDDQGVAAEVLFPDADVLGTGRIAASPFGSGLGGGAGVEPDKALAGAKAHNRWLADFVAEAPHRRIGVAVVPILHDIEAAVDEIRASHQRGLKGVLIPTRWFDQPAYHDPRYEPVWSVCEELGMIVHTHSGAGPADYGLGPGMTAIYATEAWWWAARPFWVLTWAGIFERHPELRYVIAENGAYWMADIIYKMDEKYVGGHNTAKLGNAFRETLKMNPREYLNRNCFLAASTPGVEDLERRHLIGVGNILWGNDLPHPEGTFPYTRYWIRERFRDLPEDETRQILGLNAAELYSLDLEKLQPLVDEIGPTPEEVHGDTPMMAVPA